jgi:hypothetical protein
MLKRLDFQLAGRYNVKAATTNAPIKTATDNEIIASKILAMWANAETAISSAAG